MRKDLIYKFIMVLVDIIIVNFSYFFALIARFFIGLQFRAGTEQYLAVFCRIAPFYTVTAIIIFSLFKLYHTMWRLAGIRDLNNIILASISASLLYAAGSLLTGNRLPLSIYFIAPCFQFILLMLSRFSYRIVLDEKAAIASRKQATRNVLIVGASETCRSAINYLRLESSYIYHPVCIIDTAAKTDSVVDGIPVIGGIEQIRDLIQEKNIRAVLLADPQLSPEHKTYIIDVVRAFRLELQDMEALFHRIPDEEIEAVDYQTDFKALDHVSLIVSDEKSIGFYKKLGFLEIERTDRGYDVIVMMKGPCTLEIYIDPKHPPRVNRPEALGIRHFALKVESVIETVGRLQQNGFEVEPVRESNGKHFTFLKDPDGLPIELRE